MISFPNREEWSTNPLQLTNISPEEVKLIQSTWISAGHRPGTFGNLTSQDFRERTLKNPQCPAPEHSSSHLHFRQFLKQVWCQFYIYLNFFFFNSRNTLFSCVHKHFQLTMCLVVPQLVCMFVQNFLNLRGS